MPQFNLKRTASIIEMQNSQKNLNRHLEKPEILHRIHTGTHEKHQRVESLKPIILSGCRLWTPTSLFPSRGSKHDAESIALHSRFLNKITNSRFLNIQFLNCATSIGHRGKKPSQPQPESSFFRCINLRCEQQA